MKAGVPSSDSNGFSSADTTRRARLSQRETREDKAWPSGADTERGRETERKRKREREGEKNKNKNNTHREADAHPTFNKDRVANEARNTACTLEHQSSQDRGATQHQRE